MRLRSWTWLLVLCGAVMTGCGSGVSLLSTAPAVSAPRPNRTGVTLTTDQLIARDQSRVRATPGDVAAIDQLSAAYLQKVREVGDPSYYAKVDGLLRTARAAAPGDSQALLLSGVLCLARHQFTAAFEWGQRAQAAAPHAAAPLGVIADAQVELGRYDEALATVQSMVDRRPDLTSYSRVSYVRELHGDVPGAIAAMRMAADAGGGTPENVAYIEVLLGNLHLNHGELDAAEHEYRRALFADPNYVHALAALGRVRAAQSRFDEAVTLLQQAIDIYPLPQYVITLGDVQAAMGRSGDARRSYDLAAAEQQLYQANGVDLDQELALFDADRGQTGPDAIAAARRAARDRPSVQSADALAWTLYVNGELGGALQASLQAHRLGTEDPLFFFHSGMIEAALGMTAQARNDLAHTLTLNPAFSIIHSDEARHELAALESRA
ncbi:MAG: tetratricopeptide repeat protein [Chloroflexi bacterium]|nr:MAG: tetratricopeptide repeat protein [Chloroflexota bacterium]